MGGKSVLGKLGIIWQNGERNSPRVIVIDDDAANLRMATRILSSEKVRVSCLKSGEEALKFLQENRPDLILLDIHMLGMDGFETIAALKEKETTADIPVIFLTADDDSSAETKGLKMGAMDFIKKPFVPEVLLLRIRHTIELVRLQTDLAREVTQKTREVIAQHEKLDRISTQIVQALSGAIDAKDAYINKSSKLTDEEYAIMKTHPVLEANILKNISEFPKLLPSSKMAMRSASAAG